MAARILGRFCSERLIPTCHCNQHPLALRTRMFFSVADLLKKVANATKSIANLHRKDCVSFKVLGQSPPISDNDKKLLDEANRELYPEKNECITELAEHAMDEEVDVVDKVSSLLSQGRVEEARRLTGQLCESLLAESSCRSDLNLFYSKYLCFLVEFKDHKFDKALLLARDVSDFVANTLQIDEYSPDQLGAGQSSIRFVQCRLNEVEVLKALKVDQQALDVLLNVLPIAELVYVDEQIEIAKICFDIAMQHYHLFQHSSSLPYFERAKVIYQELLGEDHTAVKVCQHNLATNAQMAALMANAKAEGKPIFCKDFSRNLAGRSPQGIVRD